MRIRDLKKIIDRDFTNIDKKIGVELVNSGFLKYKKLNPKNYDYWWYEVENKEDADPKSFTYDWGDLEPTYKMQMIKYLITRHEDNESAYILITLVLQIYATHGDGLHTTLEVYDTIYGNTYEKQLF